MRTEVYSSTKIIGYDNYKKAYCGSFIENQNSYMLNFIGRRPLSGESNQIVFFGLSDEPMLEINDTTMKYTLEIVDDNTYLWKVFALTLGKNSLAFEFSKNKNKLLFVVFLLQNYSQHSNSQNHITLDRLKQRGFYPCKRSLLNTHWLAMGIVNFKNFLYL